MIYWTNLTRKLTGMKRGLTISHGGATTNVQKRNLSKKPPSVLADVRPSGSAGDSATARLWIFRFRLLAVRACACLGERSEPTCIRQAHATVPKGQFHAKQQTNSCTNAKPYFQELVLLPFEIFNRRFNRVTCPSLARIGFMVYNMFRNTGDSIHENEVHIMQLYIGDNIKRLRRQKGITQETLAERMHVSTAAVSKWERNEALPDISMVLPLASYFGVSTDELLGLDVAKTEERIQGIMEKRNRLCALGKEHEAFDLIVSAYEEFPNDWRIVEEYMWKLYYDPNCVEPYGHEVHKEELYRLCERVLDECVVDKVRYSALSILGGLYVLDGQLEKALETAGRFPHLSHTQERELQGCYERGTAEWWSCTRTGLAEFAEYLMVDIRNMALAIEDPQESIRILKKAIALIELIFDEEDYCFWNYHLAELHIWIAHRYVRVHDLDTAYSHFEKGLQYAKTYDDLPQTAAHTSFLIRGNVFDVRNINSSTEDNDVARELGYLLQSSSYLELKDTPQMQAIIAKYQPFAGKKKDFS